MSMAVASGPVASGNGAWSDDIGVSRGVAACLRGVFPRKLCSQKNHVAANAAGVSVLALVKSEVLHSSSSITITKPLPMSGIRASHFVEIATYPCLMRSPICLLFVCAEFL